MTRNRLYLLVALACLAGVAWVGYSVNFSFSAISNGICVFKNLTSYPCPSCGATRAVQFLIQGDFLKSVMTNPIGMVLAAIMAVCPIWILVDVVFKKSSFYSAYKSGENQIRKPFVAYTLIVFVLLNWIWNFYKGL